MASRKCRAWLVCAAIIEASCNTRAHRLVTLHGFFGDKTFKSRLYELLPQPGSGSPLPKSWVRGIPIEDYHEPHRPLYIDRRFTGGDDSRRPYGLEASTLAFYAGHGDTDYWFVPDSTPNRVPLSKVRVGDGALRYFWLYSCHVMAHGPRLDGDYPAPQCFIPGMGHADLFENKRWGNALTSNSRMACGGSTFLGYTNVEEIWNYLLEEQTSVADAFILGLAHSKQVPVCLARGGPDQASSALADRTLYPEKVDHEGWLHLQYPINCNVSNTPNSTMLRVRCNQLTVPTTVGEPIVCGASAEPLLPKPDEPSPVPLPKVKTRSLPAPGPTTVSLALGFVRMAGHDAWKYQPDSGGFVFVKSREVPDRYNPLDSCNQETEWTVHPTELLAKPGLDSQVLPSDPFTNFSFTAYEMRVESRRDGAGQGKCAVRSLFLLRHSSIDFGTAKAPKRYPIFGPPAVFELQRQGNGDPVLASFSSPRRKLEVVAGETLDARSPLKTVPFAIKEAYEELQLKAEEYPIENARAILGYEEAPLRCRQQYLRPTYEIRFFPTAAARPNRPTVTMRRDARLNPSDESWKCKEWGNFPPP